MKFATHALRGLLLSCALAAPAAASSVLDFDTLPGGAPTTAGNLVGNEFAGFGVNIAAEDTSSPLALFESNCFEDSCSGNDDDLASGPPFGTPELGRVLILNEGTDSNPNDDPDGGIFRFTFDDAVFVEEVQLLDLDEVNAQNKISFIFGFADGSAEKVVTGLSGNLLSTATGDNSLRSFVFDEAPVSSFGIEFDNVSGAVSSLQVAPIPLPAGLPLAVAGLGALALLRRRKAA